MEGERCVLTLGHAVFKEDEPFRQLGLALIKPVELTQIGNTFDYLHG